MFLQISFVCLHVRPLLRMFFKRLFSSQISSYCSTVALRYNTVLQIHEAASTIRETILGLSWCACANLRIVYAEGVARETIFRRSMARPRTRKVHFTNTGSAFFGGSRRVPEPNIHFSSTYKKRLLSLVKRF